jgi:hypothetical protein
MPRHRSAWRLQMPSISVVDHIANPRATIM